MKLPEIILPFFLLISLPLLAQRTLEIDARHPGVVVAFTNVDVLPMTDGTQILENRTVLVREGKIDAIGPSNEVEVPAGAEVIDGSGRFLMPGIAEMHAHIPTPREDDDSNVLETLFLYLSNGITTIRGMLGAPYHLGLREAVNRGEILSPRVYTSSPSLNGNTVPTSAEAEAKVRQYAADGYDFLKIHPGIKGDVFETLAATAKEAGIEFAGHVPVEVGVPRAIELGYASIDHLDGYVDALVPESVDRDIEAGGMFGYNFTQMADPDAIPGLVRETKEGGVWIVPTQSLLVRWTSPKSGAEMTNEPEMIYMPGSTRFQWRSFKSNLEEEEGFDPETVEHFIGLRQALLLEMYKQGVPLLLGSDAPQVFNVPGFSIQHEMRSWAEAGIPNEAILRAGTINVARYFDAEGEYGTVTEGAAADLILLEDNPLDDIGHMRERAGVMVRGLWLPRQSIDHSLQKVAEKYAN